MSKQSIESFILQITEGKDLKDRHVIYKVIAENGGALTLRLLRQHLPRFPHQTLTARISELCDSGFIWEDSDGWFRISKLSEVEQKKTIRLHERYKKWRKVGIKMGWLN